eukprot:m51a1_g3917 putative vesicle-associated protein 1-3-like (288) ;mRNA; r:172834-174218
MPHVLDVQPDQLTFPVSSHKVEQRVFTLSNKGELSVAFKVKTNSPTRYCVRPAAGTLAPRASVEIAVMMSPGDNPPEQETKFQIQSVAMPSPTANVHDLWEQAAANPRLLDRLRLRVVYSQSNTPSQTSASSSGAAGAASAAAGSVADSSAFMVTASEELLKPGRPSDAAPASSSSSLAAASAALSDGGASSADEKDAPSSFAASAGAATTAAGAGAATEREAALQREHAQLMAHVQVLAKQLAQERARNNAKPQGDGAGGQVSCNSLLVVAALLEFLYIAYLLATR